MNNPQPDAADAGSSKGPLVLAILIIAVGVGWLLIAQGFGSKINWIWTLSLGAMGILTFLLSGRLDKVSVVVGPMFLVASFLSILRQSEMLRDEVEIPILVISFGLLLLIAQMSFVPPPGWVKPLPPGRK